VLGTRKALPKNLAKTGAETTVAAWLGAMMLLLGITLRFGRFSSVRTAFAGRSTAVAPSQSAFGITTMAQHVLMLGTILRSSARTFRR